MKPARKPRRRDAADPLLASALGVTVRTIRAWKERLARESPRTRTALRFARQGKQWQFDLPKDWRRFEALIQRLRDWASNFTRVSLPPKPLEPLAIDDPPGPVQRRSMRHVAGDFMRNMGLDGVDRTSEVEILRQAMQLKRAASPRRTDSSGETSEGLPFEVWKESVDHYATMAPFVASKFQCAVRDFPQYWPRYLRMWNEEVSQRPVTVGQGQLQPMTEAEILAECDRLGEVWPESEHWQPSLKFRVSWEFQTLCKAATDLLQNNRRITGRNLAPQLFRDWKTQKRWERHQRHLELATCGIEVFCAEQDCKRGISLSEFRQRYSREDIKKARTAAQKADGSNADGDLPSVEREDLKNMTILSARLNPCWQIDNS